MEVDGNCCFSFGVSGMSGMEDLRGPGLEGMGNARLVRGD